MDLYNLQQHIRTLATLEETGAPVVSYYLNRAETPDQNRLLLSEQERILRRTLPPKARQGFTEAMEQIETFLDTAVQPETKGVALFVRSGEAPASVGVAASGSCRGARGRPGRRGAERWHSRRGCPLRRERRPSRRTH